MVVVVGEVLSLGGTTKKSKRMKEAESLDILYIGRNDQRCRGTCPAMCLEGISRTCLDLYRCF